MKSVATVLTGLLLVSTAARAQFEMGSVVGLVVDQSKAPIASASVEIRSVDTNVARQIATSATGDYNSLPLPPGRYTVSVKQQGFRESSQEVTLSVGQRMELNFTLNVGAVNEEVTVSGTAALVETASSELSNVRPGKEIIDLPLNTRNFTQLVDLAPGVSNRGNSSNSVLQGYTSGRGTNGAVINGAPSEQVVYLFDGINSVDTDAGVLILFPPVDALAEFKVQTSAAPAAYGGGQGIINVTFKSGTNDLHGAAYEFVRNSALDARNFFDSPLKPIPPFKLNQFGFNLGGPVVLPKVLNGRNKLFFFADYEGRRVRQAQTFSSTVPITAFRGGDFSSLLPKTVLTDPLSSPRAPLPGNIIPASRIDPTSARLMQLYPDQNLPGSVSNYLYNPMQLTTIDQFDVRIDYRTQNSTLFGRVSYENPVTITPGYLPEPAVGGGPSRPGTTPIPGEQVVIGYGRSIGPTKYYEARLGFSRMYERIIDTLSNQPRLAETMGIPNANGGGAAGGLTNFSIAGTVGLGDGAGSLDKINNNWEFDQAMSWVRGRHELKFGFDLLSRRFAFFSPQYPVGQYTFNGSYTGYGLADFLYGHPISSQMDITKFFSLKRYQPAWYVQDTVRITSKLTLNFGLRDDIITAWKERHDRLAGFVPTNGGDIVTVGTAPFTSGSVVNSHFNNFAPRFGFAYNVAPKTVIRGGIGIFYAFQGVTSDKSPAKNAPFSGSLRVSNSANDFAGAIPISQGFPASRPQLFPVQGLGYVYYPQDFKTPLMNEWNINLQRELWFNAVLSVAYVGGKGTHVLAFPNVNLPVPGSTSITSRRPYPNLGDGSGVVPWGDSSFHSLQTTIERRMAKGFTLLGAWTWSHSIDDTSGTGSEAIQNPYNLHNNRGNSTFDVRQNLTLSWTYGLPFGKNLHGLAGVLAKGWQINSIDTFQSGTPFNVTMLSSNLNNGSGTQWPNRTGSGVLSNRTIDRWFDPTAFTAPPAYTYGNSGRNVLVGPGTRQFDLSVFKNVYLGRGETRRVQFRAEAFNIFNTPQFNNPNAQIGFAGVAKVTAAGNPPLYMRTSREIQLAMKLYW